MEEKTTSIHLVNKHPGHNKFYDIALKREGSGYVVVATYGAIGGNATPWPIIQNPVPFAEAWQAYAKRVKEQIEKKGYTTMADGVTMVPWQEALGSVAPPAIVSAEPVVKEHSGWEPLLLKDVEEDELELILRDDTWCAQEKMDGFRIRLSTLGSNPAALVRAANRTGYYRSIPDAVVEKARRLPYSNQNIIDGELIGEDYYAFDLIKLDGIDVTKDAYVERWALLADLVEGTGIVCVPLKQGEKDKRKFVELLKEIRAEGVVFKRLDATYRPGRTDSYRRYKFVKELEAVVRKHNDRRSVALQLCQGKGKEAHWVDVGNVTVSKGLPPVGSVVTVRYLYCKPGGSLYQPRIMRLRPDKKPTDCMYDQIIFKKGEEVEGNGAA